MVGPGNGSCSREQCVGWGWQVGISFLSQGEGWVAERGCLEGWSSASGDCLPSLGEHVCGWHSVSAEHGEGSGGTIGLCWEGLVGCKRAKGNGLWGLKPDSPAS